MTKPGSWEQYGDDEPVLQEYYASFSKSSSNVTALDITRTDGQDDMTFLETEIRDETTLEQFLVDITPPPGTFLRYIGCDQLSAKSLKIVGHIFNIHMEFWRWVLSYEAADGYWMHSHAGGRILCFDLTTFEDYVGNGTFPSTLLYGGRFRQLSSLHDFGNSLKKTQSTDTLGVLTTYQASRRVSGYLTGYQGIPVFLLFSEDVPTICHEYGEQYSEKLPRLSRLPHQFPPSSVIGLRDHFKLLSTQRLDELSEDPFGTVVLIEGKVISSWFSFYLKVARDLEMTDSMITLETPNEVLFDKATFIRREVIIALDRFLRHLEAHEGFLMYVVDGTKPSWAPVLVRQEIRDQIKSVRVLKIRTDQIRSRAQGLSDLIFNIISIRQARLAIQQSQRSVEMTALQRYDARLSFKQGESMKRISILAAVFLPLSLSASLLGMNAKEINGTSVRLWVFVPISAGTIVLTFAAVVLLANILPKSKFAPPGIPSNGLPV